MTFLAMTHYRPSSPRSPRTPLLSVYADVRTLLTTLSRPHITWGVGKYGIAPVALTNGVEYGKSSNTPYQDGTFSLMQGIRGGGGGGSGGGGGGGGGAV